MMEPAVANDTLPSFVNFLLSPAAYPHPAPEVKLLQTHISYVLLAGEFVYKFKKPVDFGFLNFSTLERRHHFCQEELLLNRRLCPDLYVDLVRVNEEEGRFNLGGSGVAVEYGVKMLRMPEARMMVNLIQAGKLSEAQLDQIVAILVPFYEKAAGGAEIREFGRAQAVAVNVRENFAQTEGFIGDQALSRVQFEEIGDYAQRFLAREELFNQRVEAGRIRDCHGDLYSANICLADKVYIYDCIEFNQRFRFCDVASDVAFLAMDLDSHGLSGLSAYFIKQFVQASGDRELPEMLNFYKCYRAYVRGKIGLFTAAAPEVGAEGKMVALAQAAKYFKLAHKYAGGQ